MLKDPPSLSLATATSVAGLPHQIDHLGSDGIAFLQEAEPEIYEEFIQAKSLPPLHPESTPDLIEICFDDVIVVSIRQASQPSERGPEKRSLSFNSNYSPDVLAIYGDKELILLKAKGAILLNRLPDTYLKSEWAVYAK